MLQSSSADGLAVCSCCVLTVKACPVYSMHAIPPRHLHHGTSLYHVHFILKLLFAINILHSQEWNNQNCTSVVAMGFVSQYSTVLIPRYTFLSAFNPLQNLSRPFAYLDLPNTNFSNFADLISLAEKLQLSRDAQDCVSKVLNETVKSSCSILY